MYNFDLILAHLKSNPSDINEHLDTLQNLSSLCNSVIELGVRSGVSTHALLAGKPNKMKSFDINPMGSLEQALSEYANDKNISWKFFNENCLTTNNIDSCDLLFIDTFHSFKQISCELLLHGNKAKKYLVFHDTVSFGYNDELGHMQLEFLSEQLQQFCLYLPDIKGIVPAIANFMTLFPHWKIDHHYENNNGLLVLKNENSTH
jgi:hypothetical protein